MFHTFCFLVRVSLCVGHTACSPCLVFLFALMLDASPVGVPTADLACTRRGLWRRARSLRRPNHTQEGLVATALRRGRILDERLSEARTFT
ncbi:hypothetical protein C8Q78DRAFT_1008201 [Trametes maxima]|nr:hypothetical protein C8Q78DRAFT_1008201 [Trametes maxima]